MGICGIVYVDSSVYMGIYNLEIKLVFFSALNIFCMFLCIFSQNQ